MASTVPQPTIGPNGILVPAQADILAAVLSDMNTAFGGNLNTVNLFTPQGQLASSLTAYIADCNSLFSYFVTQTDPATAQGFMQDALGAVFDITRLPATFTTVDCLCTGAVGTVIAAGAQAQDAAGNLYQTAGGTIGGGGTVTLSFVCLVSGPTPCPVGTLTKIMSTTPGWDSVTNTTGTDSDPLLLGQPLESAPAFEARRQQSLFINAQSPTDSIYAAVAASGASIPNVPDDVYVLDNSSDIPYSHGGITLPPNSVYVAVAGGDPDSIAQAIWTKKSLGCSYAKSVGFTASISGTTMTVTATAYGVIKPGMTVEGAGVTPGTKILSGTGPYTLDTSQTVSSTAMTGVQQVEVQDTRFFSPAPTYNVQYTKALDVECFVAVTIVNTPSLPSNVVSLVKQAVKDAFTGADGGPKARIGATFYGTRCYSPIITAVPGIQIVSVFVDDTASPTTPSFQPTIYQLPVCTIDGDITVTLV